MDTLFLAAVAEELGDLPGDVVGIGPVVAAARAAAIIAARRPDRVVLVGTGGAYRDNVELGTAIAASNVGWSYGVAVMGLGYVPRPPQPVRCDPGMLASLAIPHRAVLTSGAVTTDLQLAERLADGYDVEHLEAFGVARACEDAGVPFVAVLGISNRVGPDAHAEWLTHRDAAQDAARDAARILGADGGGAVPS